MCLQNHLPNTVVESLQRVNNMFIQNGGRVEQTEGSNAK